MRERIFPILEQFGHFRDKREDVRKKVMEESHRIDIEIPNVRGVRITTLGAEPLAEVFVHGNNSKQEITPADAIYIHDESNYIVCSFGDKHESRSVFNFPPGITLQAKLNAYQGYNISFKKQ